MKDLVRAKELLISGGYTCVLCSGERVYTSDVRGVKPLVDFLESNVDFKGFYAADKVVGRSAAFLYALLGIEGLFAGTVSVCALEVLKAHGIHTEYKNKAEYIINRKGDGRCPFEEAVLNVENPVDAYKIISDKLKAM